MPVQRTGLYVLPAPAAARNTGTRRPQAGAPPSTGADAVPSLASLNDSLIEEALRFADRRGSLAQQFALEISTHPDLNEAPRVVQDFLLRTWPLVIAHTRLTTPAQDDDPGGQLAAIDEVLWSVNRDATLRQPARLFELVPDLLRRLRDGLALLGQDCRAHDPFFQTLEALHRPALRLRKARRSGQGAPAAIPVDAIAPRLPDAPRLQAQLRVGDAADLYCGQAWRRVRLDWIDTGRGQFLFCGEHGRAHTMTRRTLERLLRERLLVPAVAPRALAN